MAKKLKSAKPRPIVSRKGVLRGEPCFKGTRIPASIVGGIAKECGIAEALNTYSTITYDEAKLALEWVKKNPPKKRSAPKLGRLISSKVVRVKDLLVKLERFRAK